MRRGRIGRFDPGRAWRAARICGWLACAGCYSPDYSKGDLQLDVDAALPAETEQARICVRGAWTRTEGAGNGRLFIQGLPVGEPVEVLVDLIDAGGTRIARTDPATLTAEVPYAVTGLVIGEGTPCASDDDGEADSGDTGDSGGGDTDAPTVTQESSWLLVVRFLGSGW